MTWHKPREWSRAALHTSDRVGGIPPFQAAFELVVAIFDASKLHGRSSTVDVMNKERKVDHTPTLFDKLEGLPNTTPARFQRRPGTQLARASKPKITRVGLAPHLGWFDACTLKCRGCLRCRSEPWKCSSPRCSPPSATTCSSQLSWRCLPVQWRV